MKSRGQLAERLASAERIIRTTPVVQLPHDRFDLFAKLEFLNGVGSVKDRPALWILRQAIARGEIGPGTTLIESSSGNFACAVAVFARILELDFIAVIDPNVSPLNESVLRTLCARVIRVENRDETGGYLKSRLRTVKGLLSDIPDAYWTNQYANADAIDAHYHLTGREILTAVPSLDYVFVGVSTAGTIAGVSRRLKEHNPKVQVVAVDAEGSVIFGNPPKRRWIAGLGSSIIPPLLEHALIDDVVVVSESDTIAACRELLDRHGLFVGGSSGSAYAAVQRYFGGTRGYARPRILFLCCDRGTAYLHNVFNREWAAWRETADEQVAEPVAISAVLDASRSRVT
jgi:cysteine synthase A